MKEPKTILIKDSKTIESHDIDGINRKILFTPTIDGNRHLRFALTEVAPGSVAPLHSHPGDEVALTLSGSATLFVDGQEYEVPNFYAEDDLILPTAVNIKMLGISKAYFTYLRILLSQSGEGGGGPFETAPTSLLGNMINTTDNSNFPLGYFHISESDSFTIFLEEQD